MRPARRLEVRFNALISAAEKRDWKKVTALLAEDYKDKWGHDRKTAVSLASEALRQFIVLEITPEEFTCKTEGRTGETSARLKISGRGTSIGEVILREANQLETPFVISWRRGSWKPWDWQVVSVENAGLARKWEGFY